MLKILIEKWELNKHLLEKELCKQNLRDLDYKDIVKITFGSIYNTNENEKVDIENITEIDNGAYQGTLLYLMPFATYQPLEYEYLMTYVNYGSCSGCDTLQAIQSELPYKGQPTEANIKDFMALCKDIITNTIKPYNCGWREDNRFANI